MIDKVREHVKTLLNEGRIGAFIGLKNCDGSILPFVYEKPEDLDDDFTIGDLEAAGDARYPLSRIAVTLMSAYPDTVFGILIRGCDERALNELARWNQYTAMDRIVKVGVACPADLAEAHECRKPFPDEFVVGEKAAPAKSVRVADVAALDLSGRLEYWLKEFDRCIKCYGCRDVCPVCFCNTCSLEEDKLIRTGDLPPENPMFHLVRAAHMAGRCIDCNLCTEACPAEIPLRTLYKGVAEIVSEEFGYLTGEAGDGKSPLNMLGPDPGHTSAND